MALVIEELQRRHRWRVLGRRLLGLPTHFIDPAPDVAEAKWVETGVRRGHLRRLALDPPLFRWQEPSGAQAIADADQHFTRLFSRHPLPSAIRRLYDDEQVLRAFRKAMAIDLADFHYREAWLGRIRSVLPRERRIRVWSVDPSAGQRRTAWRRIGPDRGERQKAGAIRFARRPAAAFHRLKRVLIAWGVLAKFLWRTWAKAAVPPTPSTEALAIALVSPVREFANPVRPPDFLLGGAALRPDNTLFVPLVDLPSSAKAELRTRGLRATTPHPAIRGAVRRQLAGMMARAVFAAPGTPDWILLAATQLAAEYGRWEAFVDHHRPKKFLSYADAQVPHIGRNLILARHGIQTWYYIDSYNYSDVYATGAPFPNVHWSHLTYDHLAAWNRQIIDYFALHSVQIGESHVTGCLWSQHIVELASERTASDLQRRLDSKRPDGRSRVIAVFDSWYHREGINRREDVLAFARGVERLLLEFPDAVVVLKEKIPRGKFAARFYKDARAIYESYDRIRAHPRSLVLTHDASSAEITHLADLVVSFPFTSVTYEALAARRRAIYYDPNGKFHGTPYDRAPGLVVHGESDLVQRTRELLYTITEDEYAAWLDQHVRGKIEPYLDGKGITRLRQLLAP